jgi:hypothetical protein
LKEINSIQLIEKKNCKISKEYKISIEDINNSILNENQKSEIIKLIVKIYSLYDIPYLIESKGSNEYNRAILELINSKQLKFCDMTFKNEESIIQFQNRLLLISESKSEINCILKLSKGLTKCLMFIISNYQQIYNILKNKEEFLQISLMKALINSVNYNNQIRLSPEIILKYFKYCLYFKLDLKELSSIQLIIEKKISKFQRNIIYQMKI